MTDKQDIARIAHEANRAIQIITNDPAPSPHWDDAPDWQKESAIAGIESALNGATPEEQHQAWCDYKVNEGWIYGEVKDEATKTHPCLVSYDELDEGQRLKDAVYVAIVGVFKDA